MAISVLLADDHTVVCDGLRRILEAEGDISVVGDCDNGREAVRMAREFSPDVAVLDIAMPQLNGIEATRQIRAMSVATQVAILSMYATTGYIFRALQAGARGYLLKESAGREVVKAIRAINAGQRFLSPQINESVIDDYLLQGRTAHLLTPLEHLSVREREILQLVVEGKSSAEIAEILYLSVKTVETYRCRLMQKLAINNLAGLVKFAIQQGLTPLE